MSDNVIANAGSGGATFATDDVAGTHYPIGKLAHGALDAATLVSTASGLPVQQQGTFNVTVNTALPAGTSNIGDVDVLSLPALPAGTNNIGDVDVLTLPALVAGTANIGDVDIASIAAGDNNIGNVDVVTLPALVAGTANIGDVDVLTIAAGDNNIGNVDVVTLPALVAGTANIGAVDIASFAAGAITEVQGDAAHAAVVSGNPVLNGFEARTTDGTPVASGDAVRGIADTLGKQVALIGSVHDRHVNGRANFTTTTAADIIAAQGAGVRTVVMGYSITNSSATVRTKVELRDGTTIRVIDEAAAVGGGAARQGATPVFITTANAAVTARCVTTGADVEVNVSGYTIAN